jgi:hypothetical protein
MKKESEIKWEKERLKVSKSSSKKGYSEPGKVFGKFSEKKLSITT